MKFLVTGGSGFIGGAVVELLVTKQHEVANFDIKPPVRADQTGYWIAGDIREQSAIAGAVERVRPDAIIHLAAKADISSSNWADFASIHLGTQNLLGAIDQVGGVHRLANISTQLVSGPGYTPRSLTDFEPYTIYGEAKAYAEGLVMQWQGQSTWFTFRPANIWGPRHPSFANEIWKYIQGRQYLHPAGAPVLRSYGYVGNTAQQIVDLTLADPARTNRQIFYGADGVTDSSLWVDAFAQRLTGRPARRIPVPMLRLLGTAGDAVKMVGVRSPIDSGRAMRMTESYPVPLDATFALVGKPVISLPEGADRTVEWLRTLGNPYS